MTLRTRIERLEHRDVIQAPDEAELARRLASLPGVQAHFSGGTAAVITYEGTSAEAIEDAVSTLLPEAQTLIFLPHNHR